MQPVVRSTLLGLLSLAGLAACGDKLTITQPVPDTVVHGVTVSPSTLPLTVGGKGILAASVDAGAGVTVRTVTWSSSDATIASVGTDGTVTAVKVGTATVKATSVADPTVSGAAAVTVTSTTTTNPGAPVTVSISSINTTVCGTGGCASVPANLTNFGTGSTPAGTGQLDVVLNVDAGGAVLQNVTAILKCGNDSLIQSQTIASSNVASLSAEAATAPVTVSFNTTQFNTTTGVPALHNNAACTLSASAKTTTGTQSATAGQTITLNNVDFISTSMTTTPGTGQIAVATGADGLAWRAGAVNVTALPVLYTAGRSVANMTVSLVNAGTNPNGRGRANSALAAGGVVATSAIAAAPFTVTFPVATTGANGVGGVTVDTLGITVSTIDNTGITGPAVAAAKAGAIRLDNLGPLAGTYVFNTQSTTNQWVGINYAFTNAAGKGFTASVPVAPFTNNDQGGVDQATVVFQYATAPLATTPTWITVTSGSAIPRSLTNGAYALRIVETDALGNATTTNIAGTFGADNNIPTLAFSGGAGANAAGTTTAAVGTNFNLVAVDSVSGFANTSSLSTTVVRNFELSLTAADCVIGTWSTTTKICSPVATTTVVPVDGGSGLNGYYTITTFAVDQGGNASPTLTRSVVIDNIAPVSSAGVAIPATMTGGGSVVFSAPFTDNLDLVSGDGSVNYPQMTITYAGTLDTPGAAFDNVLTKSATTTLTITNFISALQQVDGANAPTGAAQKPNTVNIRASDEVGNFAQNGGPGGVAIPPANVVNGSGGAAFTAASFVSFQVSNGAKTLANGANPGAIATTVDLTATVTGSTSTGTDPFNASTGVCFYYQQTAPASASNLNEWVQIGCVGAPAITDDATLPAASGRTWTYRLTAFDPPAALGTAGAVNIRAIGFAGTTAPSSGNAISTNTNSNISVVP